MKSAESRGRIVVSVVVAVAMAGLAAFPVGAASALTFADPCGLLTQHELAKTFGQSEVRMHKSVLRSPGNSAGVLHLRCLVLAWQGRKPSGAAQEHRQLVAGEASSLRMETWVADEGATAATWRANFAAKIQGLTARAREAFHRVGSRGRTISLPKLGVEHVLGFFAPSGRLEKIRAFWWDAGAASIVSMSAVEARGAPLVDSIEQVAAAVVPQIH